MSASGALAKMVPPVLLNAELQALVVASVCFVGVWVIVTKLVQLIFSLLWPFVLLGTVYAVAPEFSSQMVMEVVPGHLRVFVEWAKTTLPGMVLQRGAEMFQK